MGLSPISQAVNRADKCVIPMPGMSESPRNISEIVRRVFLKIDVIMSQTIVDSVNCASTCYHFECKDQDCDCKFYSSCPTIMEQKKAQILSYIRSEALILDSLKEPYQPYGSISHDKENLYNDLLAKIGGMNAMALWKLRKKGLPDAWGEMKLYLGDVDKNSKQNSNNGGFMLLCLKLNIMAVYYKYKDSSQVPKNIEIASAFESIWDHMVDLILICKGYLLEFDNHPERITRDISYDLRENMSLIMISLIEYQRLLLSTCTEK